ncbi:hypothetical protein AGMMS49975_06360 [Clostridia bacterium]|nr:hypothetical protein AGMMS49975_06360 [Clostridia bacterium]
MPAKKRDPNLREKLAVECDGIFMWALEGLKRLMANSYLFSETDRTKAEIQRYRAESNSALLFLAHITRTEICIKKESNI